MRNRPSEPRASRSIFCMAAIFLSCTLAPSISAIALRDLSTYYRDSGATVRKVCESCAKGIMDLCTWERGSGFGLADTKASVRCDARDFSATMPKSPSSSYASFTALAVRPKVFKGGQGLVYDDSFKDKVESKVNVGVATYTSLT